MSKPKICHLLPLRSRAGPVNRRHISPQPFQSTTRKQTYPSSSLSMNRPAPMHMSLFRVSPESLRN
ncbi:uncharacterized protein BKA55DRAFT_559155 [Fusarium redolens]|uniref:Uncharacterized protein n=1 Tax=Fusarium redolens TaxID=48865 RepID=A0A9P9HY71_FUSRE|nr:uncharacterized protein BKA55DRAFT_559155 [Fusarium redolens]KAH7265531.1 hypothetical protein BKA55DRAFT_559155 [Fusarium redolens]